MKTNSQENVGNSIGSIYGADGEFERLLEVKGSCLRRWRYSGIVKKAKEFYIAYIKKCNEYGTYMDFFEPLLWYLVGCGYGWEKSSKYLSEIRDGIVAHLQKIMPTYHDEEV